MKSAIIQLRIGLLYGIFCWFQDVQCVRLSKLSIPSYRFRNADATLSCFYDLEGEKLYSVKWYKDGHEFFRYIPGDPDQKVTIFQLPGVKVNPIRSDMNQVTLENLNLHSAGQYRCEISAEAPLFNTVAQSKKMVVIVLPRSGPRISGGRAAYHVGERVNVNCTSERSKPAATLHWSINNDAAKESFLRQYPPIQHEDGLETSILGLEFDVTSSVFSNSARKRNRYQVDGNRHVLIEDSDEHEDRDLVSTTTFLSSTSLNLSLKCSSSVSTINSDAQVTETHHQKESVHHSHGFPYYSASHSQLEPSSRVTVALLMVCQFSYFLRLHLYHRARLSPL